MELWLLPVLSLISVGNCAELTEKSLHVIKGLKALAIYLQTLHSDSAEL